MDAPVLIGNFLMHLMMTLWKNLRPYFWKWGHVDCMWYMKLSKMAVRMQCGTLILFYEAFISSFIIALLEGQIT